MARPLNFLPRELQARNGSRWMVLASACLLTCALCFFIGSAWFLRQETVRLQTQSALLREADQSSVLYALVTERDALQIQLAQSQTDKEKPGAIDMMSLLKRWSEVLPPQTILREIRSGAPGRATLTGSCAELAQFAAYLSALQELQINEYGMTEIQQAEVAAQLTAGYGFTLDWIWSATGENEP